jgi:hypothetical protein
MLTVSQIKRGDRVALDFPPIVGLVQNVNRNRSAFLVDFRDFTKWFPVRRLRLIPDSRVRHHERVDIATDALHHIHGGADSPVVGSPDPSSAPQMPLPGTLL